MQIDITTYDRDAAFRLLGQSTISTKDSVVLASGVTAKYAGTYMRKSLGFPEIATFVVTFGAGVATNIASNVICDWLKGLRSPPEKITIDRQEVDFDEHEIKRIVTSRVTVENRRAS